MWKWLKRKPRQHDDEIKELAERLVGPTSLAVALAETARDYVAAVQAGKIEYPAHRRKNAGVAQIWADLRVEALHKLFNFGQSDPFLLSDMRRQEELLACFLDERPHLEFPQPRGDVIPDTLQAMFQVYQYLDKVGSEVCDRETDRTELNSKGRSILDRIETDCSDLRNQISAFKAKTGEYPRPSTIIELLYSDVTAKAKSIAFSAKFGPNYEGGIKFVEDLIAKQGDDALQFRASVNRVMEAKDPDHLG